MPTVTILLNETYKAKDGLYPIIIRAEHKGKRRKIPVGYKVQNKFWKDGRVISKHPDALVINAAISNTEAEIKRYFADCQLHGKPVHLELIGTGRASHSFSDYLRHRSKQYEQRNTKGGIIMHRKVDRFVLELSQVAGREVFSDDIAPDFLRRLDQHLIDNGNVENTRHKKFKFLGELYDHAIADGKALPPNHFKAYKITQKPVKKDKLSETDIKAIEGLPLKPGPLNDARNIFLFAFYTKGQRFETCVTLKRDQIRQGRIYFRTNKGNEYISVLIHSRLQAILDQYPDGDLVFPFLDALPEDPKELISVIGSANTIVNRNLKIIGRAAKILVILRFHLSRHAFAWQLKQISDNINVIQDALGHGDQRTTQVYLKALEDERLDGEMEKLYGR